MNPMTEPDDEKLAAAYNRALKLEKSGDLDGAAQAYREVLRIDPEDRGGAAVRLASMGRGEVPAKAPDAYVATLFDQHADDFEDILVDQLNYCVPLIVRDLLEKRGRDHYERMLDLGCGTGLSGEAMRGMVGHVTGLDLAEGMVEVAYDKGIYDDLYVGEAVEFLEEFDGEERWDLIVATDVLPYVGDLDALFAGAAARLKPSGQFVFSSESIDDDATNGRGFMVGAHQRFAHSEAYIRKGLERFGMSCEHCAPITVRLQDGVPVPGDLVLAQRLR